MIELFELAVLIFLLIVAPVWIIAHYVTRWRTSKTLTHEDEMRFERLWRQAERMEERLDALERILDMSEDEGPRAGRR